MRFPDDISELSSIDYPRDAAHRLPVFLSSEEEGPALPKHNHNRFSKGSLATPEIPRGVSHKPFRPSISPEPSPMFRRGRSSSRDRRSNNSAEKITDKFEDSRSFEIPDQFRNDPEFMRSISYGRKSTDHNTIKLPDVTTFSEFEKPVKRKTKRSANNGFSVDTIPSDLTSKAIHSLFGDCKLNSQNLAEFQRQLQSKDTDVINLQKALREKTNELNKAKAVLEQEDDRGVTSGKKQSEFEQQMRAELAKCQASLAQLERERDYYKKISSNISDNKQRKPSGPLNQENNDSRPAVVHSTPDNSFNWHDSFEKMSLKESKNNVTSNVEENKARSVASSVNGHDMKATNVPDFATKLLSTLNEKISSHKTVNSEFSSYKNFSGKSKKANRLDFLCYDECEDQDVDGDTTIRPTASPQEAASDLYNNLKRLYDEKYDALAQLVTEYGRTDPAYERTKRSELQAKMIAASQQVEHDANLIYLLNDIAIATDLHLPDYHR